MNKKNPLVLVVGAAISVAATAAFAEDRFVSLAGMDVAPMNAEAMAATEGMAHTTYPLGALLADNTGGRIAGTPAWTEGHGLHPSGALSKAQVPGRGE